MSEHPDDRDDIDFNIVDMDDEGFCPECGEPWDQCDHFFLNWICGMMPDGQCALAGTEECDWECPRHI